MVEEYAHQGWRCLAKMLGVSRAKLYRMMPHLRLCGVVFKQTRLTEPKPGKKKGHRRDFVMFFPSTVKTYLETFGDGKDATWRKFEKGEKRES